MALQGQLRVFKNEEMYEISADFNVLDVQPYSCSVTACLRAASLLLIRVLAQIRQEISDFVFSFCHRGPLKWELFHLTAVLMGLFRNAAASYNICLSRQIYTYGKTLLSDFSVKKNPKQRCKIKKKSNCCCDLNPHLSKVVTLSR